MNDRAYYERRDVLLAKLRDLGPSTSTDLARELGWGSAEVSGKLMSARTDRRVTFDSDSKTWWVR